MKASKYNLFFTSEGDQTILYNTLYGSLTQLTSAEAIQVRGALESPDAADSDTLATLARQKHLIDDAVDEAGIIRNRRKVGIESLGRLDVVVMPTLDCNFECIYCFEDRQPSSRISAETEARLAKWLEQNIPRSRLTLLHWYGGEPLLDTPLIHRLSKHCADVATSNNTSLALHLTTNGYLLSGKRLELLLDAGVKYFQVTLDGPRRTHDALRPLRGGLPSFDTIVSNIIEALNADPAVRMTLRVNMNHTNIEAVTELFDSFPAPLRERLSLAVEPIFGDECVSATQNLERRYIAEQLDDIYRIAEEYGYGVSLSKTLLLTGRRIYCYAERDNQFIFGPSGAVFKCAAGSFSEADRVGDLGADGELIEYQNRCSEWMALGADFSQQCWDCVYLPLCMGGCRRVQATEETRTCTLIPTNAAYTLKQIALTGNVAKTVEHALSRGGTAK